MRKQLGYDINTGEPILTYADRLEHVGLGYYQKTSEITQEDRERRERFFGSIDAELRIKKMGFEES